MTSLPARRVAATTAATAVAGLLATAVGAVPAVAALPSDCTGKVRYATTGNTLYVSAGTWELPDLRTVCGVKQLTEPEPGVWYLEANLKVEKGATLGIHGKPADAADTVTALRLKSAADGTRENVVEITAQYGTIDVRDTEISSWRPEGGVDTDPTIPASAGSTGKGRAFLRAVSFMEGSTPRESRLDITNSELHHLGYKGGEAYGVSYKARGCAADAAGQEVCKVLDVNGTQRNSTFDANFFGTYTWGADDMVFDQNTYSRNVMYGLDPHDDSDNLTITRNTAFGNGTHGIICSQRCNDLTIVGNTVYSNGKPPHLMEGDDDASDNQVHGIMLHRGVTDTVVKDNTVYDHPNGAGIAVFDSMGNTIADNRISDSKYGLRVSVGSAGNTFSGNVVKNSASHAVYAYPGVKDTSTYANPSNSHPVRNTFVDNTFDGAGTLVNLLSSDEFTFTRSTVSGTVGPIVADSSKKLVWQGSPVPSSKGVQLRRSSTARVVATQAGSFPLLMDGTGTLEVWSPKGLLAEVSGLTLYSTVSEDGSLLTVPGSAAGTTPRTVTVRNVSATTSTGSMSARVAPSAGATIVVRSSSKATTAGYRVGRLVPGRRYAVLVNGREVLRERAGRKGTLSFALGRKGAGRQTITIQPAR